MESCTRFYSGLFCHLDMYVNKLLIKTLNLNVNFYGHCGKYEEKQTYFTNILVKIILILVIKRIRQNIVIEIILRHKHNQE